MPCSIRRGGKVIFKRTFPSPLIGPRPHLDGPGKVEPEKQAPGCVIEQVVPHAEPITRNCLIMSGIFMAESHKLQSVNGSRMAQNQSVAANSCSADRVIEVARNELELLLQQRSIINKKVKQVKRAVEGLTILLGESRVADKVLACACREQAGSTGMSGAIFTGTGPGSAGTVQARFANTLATAKLVPSSHGSKNETSNAKLERACRIALLESEEAATASHIYDRITRRRSYRMKRYKHPLAQVIATLRVLAERGEIETQIKGDVRHWRWIGGAKELENEFADARFHCTTG